LTEFVSETIPRILSELSYLAFLAVFLGGVLTSLGPCNLSMVPVIMGYVAGQQELTRTRGFWLSLFFTLGSSVTFVLLGVAAATVGGLFLGAIRLNLDFMSRLQPKQAPATGLVGAFGLGLIVGLAGSQCATPVLAAILNIVMGTGKIATGAFLLFGYALGRGVPVVLAGTFSGVVKALPALERWQRWMESAAGVVLIGVGLYFVWIA
jgi:cytochrome c-type biogenesis protein